MISWVGWWRVTRRGRSRQARYVSRSAPPGPHCAAGLRGAGSLGLLNPARPRMGHHREQEPWRERTKVRKTVMVGGLLGGAAIVCAAPASSVYVALLFLAVSYASLAIAATGIWSLPGDIAPSSRHVASIGGIRLLQATLKGPRGSPQRPPSRRPRTGHRATTSADDQPQLQPGTGRPPDRTVTSP